MATDLFGDSVENGWNSGRERITDDFLSEANNADVDPQPTPRQQPQQQQPRRSFVPEGYEAPSTIQAKYDRLVERYRILDRKLAKAQETDADKNPYSVMQDGQAQFDNLKYNDDMRQLGSLKMEIDNLKDKLRDSRETAQVGQQGVRQYARDFFFKAQEHIEENLREATKQKFSAYFQDLVRERHFENPTNLAPERLDGALANIFRASLGDAVLAQARNAATTTAKSPGTNEDDPPTPKEKDDLDDMPEESRRMVEAWERSQAGRGGTLADRARQGGSR